MVEFDSLPPKSRSLILATLALDIVSRDCRSIFDLALRRNQTVNDVWRDICRRTAQPHCTMPRRILESQYTGTLLPVAGTTPAPAVAPTASPFSNSVATPAERWPSRAHNSSVIQLGDLIAIQTAEPAPRPSPPTSARSNTVPKWQFMMAAGAAAMIMLAAGFAIVIAIPDSAQTTAASLEPPVLTVGAKSDSAGATVGARAGAGAPADTVSVPVPQGTLRRLDAISKGFSRQ